MTDLVDRSEAYVAPAVVVVGSLEQLTQGHKTGGHTDMFFPAGTPRGDITFS